jgi:hypothetical protein
VGNERRRFIWWLERGADDGFRSGDDMSVDTRWRLAGLAVPALLTLGLSIAGIWTNTVGYSMDLLPTNLESFAGVASVDAFRCGRLFTALVFIAFARLIPRVQKPLVVITALLMCFASAMLVISYHQTLVSSQALALAGVFIAIAAYSFIVWVFYFYFAQRFTSQTAVWCIAISLILETVLSILVGIWMQPLTQALLVICAPLVVAACYFVALALGRHRKRQQKEQRVSGGYEKYALLAQVVIITVALVLIQALSDTGTWGETRGNVAGITEFSLLRLIIIAAVILLLTWLVFFLPRRHLSLTLSCIIGFAACLGGLQILSFSQGTEGSSYLDAVTTAIEQFAHLVRWLMVIECVRLIAMPPYRIAGVAHSSFRLNSRKYL